MTKDEQLRTREPTHATSERTYPGPSANPNRPQGSIRYRLKLATWTVVREANELSPRLLASPEAAAVLARELVREFDDDKERLWLVLLDSKLRYRMHSVVAVGNPTSCSTEPRSIFGPAVREGAGSLFIVHNHPSGDPEPSRADLDFTERLVAAGKLLSIPVVDHIIVGNGSERFVSLHELGKMKGGHVGSDIAGENAGGSA